MANKNCLIWCASVIFVITVLFIIFRSNRKVQYFAKISLYMFDVMLTTTLTVFVSLPWPGDVENFRFVKWTFLKLTSWIDIQFELNGEENLNFDGPAVLICNHQSSLDLIGMMVAWPSRCVPLIKKELMYAGPFGVAGKLCGCVFVDRFKKNSAVEKVNTMVKTVLEKGVKIWIFPEGTRNHEGAMLPFKKGAFYLATQAKIPIIPIIFSSYDFFYSKKERRFSQGLVIINVLPAVSPEDATVDQLAERTRALMLTVFDRISEEARQRFSAGGMEASKSE